MEYKIQGLTVWIKGNGIYSNYIVQENQVSKLVQLASGDEILEPFHTIGELPLNSEAKLLNQLREQGAI